MLTEPVIEHFSGDRGGFAGTFAGFFQDNGDDYLGVVGRSKDSKPGVSPVLLITELSGTGLTGNGRRKIEKGKGGAAGLTGGLHAFGDEANGVATKREFPAISVFRAGFNQLRLTPLAAASDGGHHLIHLEGGDQ